MRRNMTLSVVLVLMTFTEGITAIHHVTCPAEPIQAREDDNVTLQCRLVPPVDLRRYILDFTRADLQYKVVHTYQDGRDLSYPQMDQYRNRTTLIHEDLIQGTMTLKIYSVQMSDSGRYECYVPDLTAYCTLCLTVVRKDQDNKTNMTTTNICAIVLSVIVALIGLGLILRVLVKHRNLCK
uniref:Immunoglobulin domain-containing protein n=1 Tax=Lates calcarifer TaxID=8187 RepID=A0A4W6G827_LATCA